MNNPANEMVLLQALPQMTWTNLPNGEVNFYNERWYNYTGLTFEETKEWGWKAVVHPDDLPLTFERFMASLASGNVFEVENRYKRADGEYRWHLNRALPIKNERGEIYLWIGTATDIEEKKQIEGDLKIAESKFRSLIEEATVAVGLYTGREMKIEIANDLMLGIWGKGNTVIGKLLAEALPELRDQPFLQTLDDVYTTGKTFEGTSIPVDLVVDGVMGTYYFDFSYKAVRNGEGEIYGVLNMATDVTEQVKSRRKLENAEFQFRSLIEEATVAACLFKGREMKIEIANDLMIGMWGKGKTVMGKPLAEAVPELQAQQFLKILDEVFTTGETFEGKAVAAELEVDGVLGTYYFDFSYKAMRNEEGEIYGVMDMAIDVTEQVLARQKLEDNQRQLVAYFEQSPVAIATIDKEELTFRLVNPFYAEIVGRKADELINKPLLEALPELQGQGFDRLLEEVIATGVPFVSPEVAVAIVRGGELQTIYVNLAYQPQRGLHDEVTGVLVVAVDVTVSALARKKVEEGAAKLRAVIDAAPAAIGLFVGPDLIIENPNELLIEVLGKSSDIVGKSFNDVLSGTVERDQAFLALINNVYNTGEKFTANEVEVIFNRSYGQETKYFNINFIPLFEQGNKVYAVLDVSVEVTDQVLARKKIEGKEEELRNLIQAVPVGICVLSGDPVRVVEINDRFLEISGKTREQYANGTYWEVLKEVEHIFKPILDEVFATGIKYVTPESEMVLIRAGVPEKIFLTFEYIPLLDANGTVTKVVVIALEITQQVKTRKKIEEAVAARTIELRESNINLQRSNNELEQFAYIASHDLQEPIRKISTFSEMLEGSIDNLSDKSKGYLNKINTSTERMSKLIRDVLAFSKVSQTTDSFSQVDLGAVVDDVKTDFEVLIEQKKAVIECINLPVIEAVPSQMVQLFGNLLSNSLKYTKAGVAPVIKIHSTLATAEQVNSHPQLPINKKYYHIEFSDNGIGFDEEHAGRIFNIFQRLHGKTEFEGTGIGLSICRKIVQSHHGHIAASVGANGGAVFIIILPETA